MSKFLFNLRRSFNVAIDIHELAVRHAPIIYHAPDEPNLPTNVEWLLTRTSLWFCDNACQPKVLEKMSDRPSQHTLISQQHDADCGLTEAVRSAGTRSWKKQRTFFLADLAPHERRGSDDPKDWTTYYHAYPNDVGGVTIQYWRLHAYNTGRRIGVEVGFHGGDWEGIHVVFNASNSPMLVRLLDHSDIPEAHWTSIDREGDHPIIYSERAGHASRSRGSKDGIRQETWGGAQGAKVSWPGRGVEEAGDLTDVGEKSNPANGHLFIQYSGLWGSPSKFPASDTIVYYASSGYWGPAYNETLIRPDGFVTAWGRGALEPKKVVNGVPEFCPASFCR